MEARFTLLERISRFSVPGVHVMLLSTENAPVLEKSTEKHVVYSFLWSCTSTWKWPFWVMALLEAPGIVS
jgi:hypothetical protein